MMALFDSSLMAVLFQFEGRPRWSWPFDTPNQLGLAGVVALLLALGSVAGLVERTGSSPHPRAAVSRLLLLPLIGIVIIAAIVTAGTYSRGATVAVFIGSLVLAWSSHRDPGRAVALGGLVLYLGLVLGSPSGAERLATLAPAAWEDGSIANRFSLWKGALAMLWDHPVEGVGFARFRETYAAWYQPVSLHGNHLTALNDLLTVGACSGLPALGMGGAAIALVTALGADGLRIRPSGIRAGLLAAWVAYLTASQFSTFALRWITAWIPLGLAVAIILARAQLAWRGARVQPRLWIVAGAGAMALVSAAVMMAAIAGRAFAHRPLAVEADSAGAPVWRVEPRASGVRGEALIVSADWSPERDARRVWRGLAAAGWRVRAWRPPDLGFTSVEAMGGQLAQATARTGPDRPVVLVAHGAAGRPALAAAAEAASPPPLVVIVGTPAWFALPELSPLENVRRLRGPLLVAHIGRASAADPADARQLAESVQAAGGAVALAIVGTAADAPPDKADVLFLDALLSFLAAPPAVSDRKPASF